MHYIGKKAVKAFITAFIAVIGISLTPILTEFFGLGNIMAKEPSWPKFFVMAISYLGVCIGWGVVIGKGSVWVDKWLDKKLENLRNQYYNLFAMNYILL